MAKGARRARQADHKRPDPRPQKGPAAKQLRVQTRASAKKAADRKKARQDRANRRAAEERTAAAHTAIAAHEEAQALETAATAAATARLSEEFATPAPAPSSRSTSSDTDATAEKQPKSAKELKEMSETAAKREKFGADFAKKHGLTHEYNRKRECSTFKDKSGTTVFELQYKGKDSTLKIKDNPSDKQLRQAGQLFMRMLEKGVATTVKLDGPDPAIDRKIYDAMKKEAGSDKEKLKLLENHVFDKDNNFYSETVKAEETAKTKPTPNANADGPDEAEELTTSTTPTPSPMH